MELQRLLFSPYHFILADNPLPETMKQEYYQSSEQVKECEEESSHVSTELTLSSCEFQNETKKFQTRKTSFSSCCTPREELTLSFEFQTETKKLQTTETSFATITTPTELTHSCEFQTMTKNLPFQASETSFYTTTPTEELVKFLSNNDDQYPEQEVSTALKLCDESWISKKRKIAEERHWGGSRKLIKLSNDPWKIKKKLTESDLGHLSRLLVRSSLVKNHVLPFLGADCAREVESKGIQVIVWDKDTKSKHQLVFKQWRTSKSYVFIGMWHQDFVIRRELKQGDEIGLYWDSNTSMFNFCVLQRARMKQLSETFSVSLGYKKRNYVCF
ncbi:hypothetical protein RGQ29_008566 [Quercus rubra]|uniref:TF-B3 domain-containing protein n=1 Tax=Quercus rubra TaxID=3512 RepID=A0AAN7E0M8_QUERU|nr:hypothetical protein RGQ29_008566 [Quercus rubra]